ncbi:MAG: DUF4202 domain-containing protein [Candidatus Omnitrophica bacterium]|nr:DUF4202 domain-containing protein [Candidatus Omnitrophota bacterium]
MDAQRLPRLLDQIDRLNQDDPTTESIDGKPFPRELAYARRVTTWVLRLAPEASEWLRIAARGQHVRRWTIPRERYPRTRAGYLRWRETLKTFHAKTVAELMRQAGYAPEDLQRVESLILKKRPADDPEMRVLEDALCLVFLETQLADTRAKVPDGTMREVVRKTWRKMSERGRREALVLPMDDAQRAWLSRVLESEGRDPRPKARDSSRPS